MLRKRKNATDLRPLATCPRSASRPFSALNCAVRRRTCALKPPASPRSAATGATTTPRTPGPRGRGGARAGVRGGDDAAADLAPREQRAVAARASGDVAHHLLDVVRVGAGLLYAGLRLAELHRGDRLESPRDLGDVLDRADLPFEIPERRQILAPRVVV